VVCGFSAWFMGDPEFLNGGMNPNHQHRSGG
jgi:hypothetical protein